MKDKKYKVIIPEHLTEKISKLPEEDQREFMKVCEEIVDNPFKGQPVEQRPIEAWPHEKCKCGIPFYIFMDQREEVYITPQCDRMEKQCDSSWMTKKELIKARTAVAIKAGAKKSDLNEDRIIQFIVGE